ncbi:killer protein [Trinickia violacea]|uniref:Killer protein n=2 Tax=Trinickia violacea TaxID=2571746 RepID=A0A4P8J2L4_9BURK|nr:killer protein [Trinickia violacea]
MTALAFSPAHADESDPSACGAVLCLAGELLGSSGGENCSEYESQYFSIVRYHHGHMDLGPTSNARMAFLNQCQDGDDQTKHAVNDRYGTSWGL